ncbi:hypothetical protein M5K25_017827 [Dendrobium thyrsiflorum]|uniref:Uncharacterized protein n=1 Tax=Dendrobium thyrsiflorum TaxID=117978 RepID=A0ABD0UNX6_DENTH
MQYTRRSIHNVASTTHAWPTTNIAFSDEHLPPTNFGSVPEVDIAQYRNSVPLGIGTRYNLVLRGTERIPSSTEGYRAVPSGTEEYRAVPGKRKIIEIEEEGVDWETLDSIEEEGERAVHHNDDSNEDPLSDDSADDL